MEILDRGQREFSGFARGRVSEVKLGVVEAEWLTTERGRVTLAAIGQDVATFDEHVRAPGGVPPYSVLKVACFSDLTAR